MSELSQTLRELIEGEGNDAPPAEAVARGWARLQAAAPSPPAQPAADAASTTTTAPTASATVGGMTKLALAVVASGALGYGAYAVLRAPSIPETAAHVVAAPSLPTPPSEPAASVQPVVAAPRHDPVAPPAPMAGPRTGTETGSESAPAPTPERVRKPRKRPLSPKDALEAELALMRAASRALAAEQPRRALRLARRHAKEFPSGALEQERHATQAIAHCALGHAKGVALASRFVATYPRSAHIGRVQRACNVQ